MSEKQMTPEQAKFLRRQARAHNPIPERQKANEAERERAAAIEREMRHNDIDQDRAGNMVLRKELEEKLAAIAKIENEEERKAALLDPAIEELIHKVDKWVPDAKARERKKKAAEALRAQMKLSEERKQKRDAHRALMKKGKIKI
jgi:hypothetical protein